MSAGWTDSLIVRIAHAVWTGQNDILSSHRSDPCLQQNHIVAVHISTTHRFQIITNQMLDICRHLIYIHLISNRQMGCGSSVSQVTDSLRQGVFRPIRLMDVDSDTDTNWSQGRIFLFGQSRTQRKIIECDLNSNFVRSVLTRTRIPMPKIHYDPLELMYEQSQQIFHLGVYGFSTLPPFNKMLALHLQPNLIFLCGGRDFEGYNIKNESYFYVITDEPLKRATSEIIMPVQSDMSERTMFKSKYSSNKFQKMASMSRKRYGHFGIFHMQLRCVFVFGGCNEKDEVISSCQRYSIMENNWKDVASMKIGRVDGHCFQYHKNIYVFGGEENNKQLCKQIQTYNPETNQWETLSVKIHRGIRQAVIFSLNPNEIMIAGGRSYSGFTKSVIKINLDEQTYIWNSDLHYDYKNMKSGMSHDKIIIFGGAKDMSQKYNGEKWNTNFLDFKHLTNIEQMAPFTFSALSTVVKNKQSQRIKWSLKDTESIIFGNDQCPCILIFDRQSGQFRKQAVPMNLRLKAHMGVLQYEKNQFILAGGCNRQQSHDSRDVFYFNAENGQASETIKMHIKKYDFAICAVNGVIYTFGGYSLIEKVCLKGCEKFDLQTEFWTQLPSLRRSRRQCCAEVINANQIAVFGGINKDSQSLGIQIYNINSNTFDLYIPQLVCPKNIQSWYFQNNQQKLLIFAKSEYERFTLGEISLNGKSQKIGFIPQIDKSVQIKNYQQMPQERQVAIKMEDLNKGKLKQQLNHDYRKESSLKFISLSPEVIAVKPKRQIDNVSDFSSSNVMEEERSQFDIDRITFEQNQIIRQSLQNKGPMPHSTERKWNDGLERQKKIKTELIETNPLKITQKDEIKIDQNVQVNVKQIDWLPRQLKSSIIKRMGEIFFFFDHECVIFNVKNLQRHSVKLTNSTGIQIQRLK